MFFYSVAFWGFFSINAVFSSEMTCEDSGITSVIDIAGHTYNPKECKYLDLQGAQVQSSLLPSLADFQALEHLNIANNELTGILYHPGKHLRCVHVGYNSDAYHNALTALIVAHHDPLNSLTICNEKSPLDYVFIKKVRLDSYPVYMNAAVFLDETDFERLNITIGMVQFALREVVDTDRAGHWPEFLTDLGIDTSSRIHYLGGDLLRFDHIPLEKHETLAAMIRKASERQINDPLELKQSILQEHNRLQKKSARSSFPAPS